MNVTKQQIIDGVVKYAKNEVIDKITDKPLKMAIAIGVSMLETSPIMANAFFDNDIVEAILDKRDDDTYDIERISKVLEKTFNEYGDFPVTIPSIKFISPTEKTLNFSSRDIQKLRNYITGVGEVRPA